MIDMTKREFSIIASALRTYYPKENILPNEPAMQLWYDMLQDLSYDLVQISIQKWVATNKWSPSISELRQIAMGLCSDDTNDWGEAWEKVRRAISRYGSYQELEALDSMDEVTRKCVKSIGWMNLCMSEELSIERASFRKLYETYSERQKEVNLLPNRLVSLIEETKVKMIEGGTENGRNGQG